MNDWFDWNGTRCTTKGIHVLEQPTYTLPAERSTFTAVPGRSGSLTTLEGDEVYDDIVLTATCIIDGENRIPTLSAWLKGGGTVPFANRPGVPMTFCDFHVTIRDNFFPHLIKCTKMYPEKWTNEIVTNPLCGQICAGLFIGQRKTPRYSRSVFAHSDRIHYSTGRGCVMVKAIPHE